MRILKFVAVALTMGVSTEERLNRLSALDLSNVRRKLMEPYPEGKGWNEDQSKEAEMWYKRYLAVIIKYPDATQHVPNGPIDFFWHQHILDTMSYGPDCEHVLGYFLHHYPYFGLNGDAAERDSSFDDTNALYVMEFGEDCTHMKSWDSPRSYRNLSSHIELLPPAKKEALVVAGCTGKGSGTGCRQGCSRKG